MTFTSWLIDQNLVTFKLCTGSPFQVNAEYSLPYLNLRYFGWLSYVWVLVFRKIQSNLFCQIRVLPEIMKITLEGTPKSQSNVSTLNLPIRNNAKFLPGNSYGRDQSGRPPQSRPKIEIGIFNLLDLFRHFGIGRDGHLDFSWSVGISRDGHPNLLKSSR